MKELKVKERLQLSNHRGWGREVPPSLGSPGTHPAPGWIIGPELGAGPVTAGPSLWSVRVTGLPAVGEKLLDFGGGSKEQRLWSQIWFKSQA